MLITETQQAEIKRRVAAGAAAFDEKALPQWPHLLLDRPDLDVGNSFRCPGAVAFGSYRNALLALIPDAEDETLTTDDTLEAAQLGLTIRDPDLDYGLVPFDDAEQRDREVFALLTSAWLDEARKRVQ